MLSNEQYEFIAEGCEDMDLDALWDYFSVPFGCELLRHDLEYFEERKEGFLWVIERLMVEKKIILVDLKNHAPLSGSIKEQVQLFMDRFPGNDQEMDNGIWFFMDDCPGGCNWRWQP